MKIIARQQYIEHIQRFIGKGMIIALTGQRRVGKSYIIRQLVTEIEALKWKYARLAALRDTLLPKLISGELKPE
ncbi:MAG: hypothetical protein K2I37_04145 [Muribaculaceae bacterium]|nr:hypothetical protein [Muribaculaceae bacterium]MDE7342692.1 hypothetical protein [Muribaculaceae bacterium]